jgi:hypothetical protein
VEDEGRRPLDARGRVHVPHDRLRLVPDVPAGLHDAAMNHSFAFLRPKPA